jgi:hypothetical protein
MPCQKCKQLEKEHTEAVAAFDAASARLRAKGGILSRKEYQQFQQAVLVSQQHLDLVRAAIDRHAQKHMGETMDQAPAQQLKV